MGKHSAVRTALIALAASFLTAGAAVAIGAPASAADAIGGPLMSRSDEIIGIGASDAPGINAAAWVVANADTGEILAAKDPHGKRPMASTLKTLTALTFLPLLDKNSTHTITDEDIAVSCSCVGLKVGSSYRVEDLWYGLFLPSGNDAAQTLASAAGGLDTATAKMNANAVRIQALDTHAVNTSGLDEDGQVSSAYDLALIFRQGLKNPDFVHYASTLSYKFPGDFPGDDPTNGKTHTIYNQNRLLQHGFDGIIGGKTGYTTNAGRTFVAAAQRNGVTLVISLLGITDATEDAAGALLDWGFANYGKVQPVGTLVDPVDATPTAQPSSESAPASPAPMNADSGASPAPATSTDVTAASQSAPAKSSGLALPVILALLLVLAVGAFLLFTLKRGGPMAEHVGRHAKH